MRFIALILALLISCAASAQVPMTGAGLGAPTSGAAYTGIGDILAAQVYNALRCYSNAYSGNVADITDAATGNTTGTRLKCSAGGTISAVSSGSACATTTGGATFVTGGVCSPLATTCASACNVVTLYDQSGNTNCTSTACDLTQATNANRPTFNQSCSGLSSGVQHWCMTATQSTAQYLKSVNSFNGTGTQPYSFLAATSQSSPPTSNAGLMGVGASFNGGALYLTIVGVLRLNSGSDANVQTLTYGTWYSVQAVFNGASSSALVNGASTTGLSPGTNADNTGPVSLLTDIFSDAGSGSVVEDAVFTGSTSTSQAALQSNVRTFWGF